MDYKQLAVIKEQQLKQKVKRLSVLLYNTLTLIEEYNDYDHEMLLDALGMSENEYKEIMK